jgi:hypothetical protein
VNAETGSVWRLVRDGEQVGEIVVEEADWPWRSGPFVPGVGFGEFEALFDAELAVLEAEDFAAWEEIYARITGALTLLDPDGAPAEYVLHVQDGRAWFRT